MGIRTPENIGGLIRLAGNIGCRKVIIVSDEENHKLAKIKKTATTAFNKVDWEIVSPTEWYRLIPTDYQIIALETTPKSELIYHSKLEKKTAIIVGDERFGIDLQTLELCHKHLYIPMTGSVKSLNVVQAATVALFELVRQSL
jgi:TrmH family RNA methyltransferase